MAGVMYNAIPSTSADPAHGLALVKKYSARYLKGLYAKPGAWQRVLNVTTDAGMGQSVEMGELPTVTAQDVTVSTGAFTYDNTSILARSVTIDKIKAVAHSLPDHTLIQSAVDIKAALSENAGLALQNAIDGEMTELIASISTNSAGSANADLTEDSIWASLQKLVETGGSNLISNPSELVFILPGSQYGPCKKALKGYTNFRYYSGGSAPDGANDLKPQIDTIAGIDTFWRNDSSMTVSSGKIGGLFHRDSVGVAIQKAASFRISPISGTVNTELLAYNIFGIGLLSEKRAVKVLCK